MAENEKKKRTLWEQAVENALHFAFNLAFVFIFQSIFGVQNVLPGVAISVGMTMFPDGYIGVRPVTMAGIIIGLYCGCVIAGQTALMLPAAALVIDFLFVLLIMAPDPEPTMAKPPVASWVVLRVRTVHTCTASGISYASGRRSSRCCSGGGYYGYQVVLAGTREGRTRFKGTDKAVHGTERLYIADVYGDSGSYVYRYGPSPEKAPVD